MAMQAATASGCLDHTSMQIQFCATGRGRGRGRRKTWEPADETDRKIP